MFMNSSREFELFISPKIVMVVLIVLGGVAYFIAEIVLPYSWETTNNAISYGLLMSLIAIIGWVSVDRYPTAGRWFTLLTLIAAVHLGYTWLRIPGALAWGIIPVVLAAPLLGLRVAILTAIVETGITLGLSLTMVNGLNATIGDSERIVVLLTLWVVFFALFVTRYELHKLALRLSEQYENAKELLEEARDNRAEVVQALDDLAHANRQLTLLNKRVSDLRLIAEEGQKAKTNFVARVSHEFRTPLNMIIGLVDLVLEAPEIYDATLSPRLRDTLQIVHRNCQHLTNMVNDVLDLSRLETERMVLHKQVSSIQQIVMVAVDAVRPLLESKNLAIVVEVPDDLPPVYCDSTRIEQVILNLVSNSARFTQRGKVGIKASKIENQIRVIVEDTGPGISPADLERIFEPFAQGTSEFQANKAGSGLGLSISKKFIELHNGRMWVESEFGVGSSFVFELPLLSPATPFSRPGHQIQEGWKWLERRTHPRFPDSHYRPRIIVCDETGDLCAMLARVTSEVDLVDSRGIADVIHALNDAPAQAILVNRATAEEAHGIGQMLSSHAKGTPILGCTVQRSLDQVKRLGLQGYLTKPVNRADLARILEEFEYPIQRVLIVDDDQEVTELFRDMLYVCDSSLQIETLHNGKAALNRLRGDALDLMLLDHVMPEMDGLQLLDAMAREEGIPKVPTYFISAQAPWDQPVRSNYLYVNVEDGFSLNQLLLSSLGLSQLLLQPDDIRDQGLG